MTPLAMPTTAPGICTDPDIQGGRPIFVGTRVPFQSLIDYIVGGHTLDQFLDDFPTVSRDLAQRALDDAHEALGTSPLAR